MADRRIGIILNGATAQIAQRQHLGNVLVPILGEGGLSLAGGDRAVPDILMVGRNESKLKQVGEKFGLKNWTTDLDAALANPDYTIYFDSSVTMGRESRLKKAIAAGKHIYTEKPIANSLDEARSVLKAAEAAEICHGVITDKIFMPGFRKLKRILDSDSLGRIVSAKIEFGWWIFDGKDKPGQRPSWNYRKKYGGGLVLDMFPHWGYILNHLFGGVESIYCQTSTKIPERVDEDGNIFAVDVEDTANALLTLAGGVPAQLLTTWATRVRRDDVMTIHVDGTNGSAIASSHKCWTQSLENTSMPRLETEKGQHLNLFDAWTEEPDFEPFKHSFRYGWELYLRYVMEGGPFPFGLDQGVKAIEFIDAAYRSVEERRVIDIGD
ncbi:MAG: Gfo/Idh/MocA family oxidoreductase [Rhodospirillaceae bacterium]|jgi:predicted dehydrogenase|nr:Gfo/Idh/MocA family oxidoreductase [Rhodospirillales bacterium]MBT3905370.1 Gfo/Idh/MocA family oxidoreductase [Rhodospirillaceae bacterium]MBT5033830.1 Gfo/Idh/MocA family oxidoreductase [Rhodospirillaceae bacterium]MBT7768491.1 Gfo/Idh/MocA family oxidoreductase [Rhodospirillales bacterium]